MRDNMIQKLEQKLGPKKVRAAYLLVMAELADPDYDGPKKLDDVAKTLGIGRTTLFEWRKKDRDFIKYKNLITDDFLSENRALVYKQLMKLIMSGNPSVKAIDIFARLEGLYQDKVTINNESNVDTNESIEDLQESIEQLKALKNSIEGGNK